MKRFIGFLALLISFFPIISLKAQNPESEPVAEIEMVVEGLEPPTKNIFFIVDTSGSMDGKKVQDAIQITINIAEAPLDDLQIAVVSFGSGVHRWPGTQDVNPQTGEIISRPGWSLMPSQDNLTLARDWLQENRDNGSTEMLPAVKHAFQSCLKGPGQVKELSIIIISDGLINNYQDIATTIDREQRIRTDNGLPRATIGFFGIDIQNEGTSNWIRRLVGQPAGVEHWNFDDPLPSGASWQATRCILGYFRLVYPPPDFEELLPDLPPPPPLPPPIPR